MIISLGIMPAFGQYQNTTVQTPKGVTVDALQFIYWAYNDFDADEIEYWNDWWTNSYNCRILANSTMYYNCHGYAWYDIEGRMSQSDLRWINDVDEYSNPIYNVTKYYSGTNKSYTEVGTSTNHLRVSYFPRDHSAVTTEDEDSLISKWAWGPLVKHPIAQCPFYPNSQIKYYRLWPQIDGTETALCQDQERTFTSNTTISGSTYAWSKDNNLLDYVSGAGTTSYRIKAKSGAGNAYLQLQITTPSGEVATSDYKYVWVGVPILNVSGPGNGYTYHTYTFYANPNSNSIPSSYTWILNPLNGNYVYNYGSYADIAFYNTGYYQVISRAQNTCGTGEYSWKGISISSGKSYTLSPNPASGNVTITVSDSDSYQSNDINMQLTTYTVSIFNFYGILQSSVKKTGTNFTIPVGNLKEGSYIVRINNGTETKSLTLMIKH